VAITRRDDGVVIDWGPSGSTWLAARPLRLACPCAQCIEEMTGRPLLDPALVPPDVRPVELGLVGSYGLRIRWSDGHDTGIYAFVWLKGQPGTSPPP
jgi:DUF971 family protein